VTQDSLYHGPGSQEFQIGANFVLTDFGFTSVHCKEYWLNDSNLWP
jgi:hypothetical protein